MQERIGFIATNGFCVKPARLVNRIRIHAFPEPANYCLALGDTIGMTFLSCERRAAKAKNNIIENADTIPIREA